MAKLFLIPTSMGESSLQSILPDNNLKIIKSIKYFIVENIRTARRFLKTVDNSINIDELKFFELNKYTNRNDIAQYLTPLTNGNDIGIMSEAGCPGIADPGADVVSIAHQKNIIVVPLVGPSSILLSMMASGMNGQNFAFNGYLPIKKDEKQQQLKILEKRIISENQSQIFIEAPYRNLQLLEDLISCCQPNTKLCIACDITCDNEYIKTKKISDWKKNIPENIQKRPVIFILGT